MDRMDKKLLQLLDLDGRASYRELARKTRSSPEVVRYRIKRMVDNGVIRNFMTLVNFSELGFIGHGVFCSIRKEAEKERVLRLLNRHPRVYWIAEFGGKYDLAFAVMAKDSLEFYGMLQKIKKDVSGALAGWDIAIRIQLTQFPRSYLLESSRRHTKVPYFGKELRQRIVDETDFCILKEISQDGRVEIASISERIGIPGSTIAFRMKRLEQDRIIQGFVPQTICQRFGYQSFQLFIEADDLDSEKRRRLHSYCLGNPNIVFLIETLGGWDFEVIYEIEDQKSLQVEMMRLKQALPWVKNVEAGIVFDHYVKYDQFPLKKSA